MHACILYLYIKHRGMSAVKILIGESRLPPPVETIGGKNDSHVLILFRFIYPWTRSQNTYILGTPSKPSGAQRIGTISVKSSCNIF